MLRQRARELRRQQTDAEQLLWQRLRDRQCFGAKFRRQHPVGRWIADFCCLEHRLVIEIDGGQHAIRQRHDQYRDAGLQERGYRVLRFWNHEVLVNCEGVLIAIGEVLKIPPLPTGERETL
ncbi:MAG: endonuclease domain-containing protein [Candidatus Omnitrophica bacterium]|nr:endonuclease domain-containing protein [Candidatus Omnitrophota bacterium]